MSVNLRAGLLSQALSALAGAAAARKAWLAGHPPTDDAGS